MLGSALGCGRTDAVPTLIEQCTRQVIAANHEQCLVSTSWVWSSPLNLESKSFLLAVYVSNLDVACLKCLCTASTGCDENYDCSAQGFCGPFFISRKYWEEAGKLTLDSRYEADSDGGHGNCVKDIHCAGRVVAEYMAKNGRVCYFRITLNDGGSRNLKNGE